MVGRGSIRNGESEIDILNPRFPKSGYYHVGGSGSRAGGLVADLWVAVKGCFIVSGADSDSVRHCEVHEGVIW